MQGSWDHGAGRDGAEVVLYIFIEKSTLDILANDLMWEFFQRHPMK
jgi:hypothetical protein